MDEVPVSVPPTVAKSRRTRLRLIASLLGVVSGAGAIGGMYLPLANLAGMGPVRYVDYDHTRTSACIAIASLVIIFSFARCFRLVLTAAGLLGGLLAATGIDLFQTLREVMNTNDGALTQMAQQLVAHSSFQAGAYVMSLCAVACIVAGLLGSSPLPRTSATTSES